MDDFVPFASREYWITLGLLLFSRGMDLWSTWIATPNLLLEANPIARRLGWRWGVVFNLVLCAVVAQWPLAAIVVATTSLLVAARNFKSAWFMRSMGEFQYRMFMFTQLENASRGLFFLCLAGETVLFTIVGAALVVFSEWPSIPMAIGVGVVAYAAAVAFYSSLSMWRMSRHSD